MIRVDRDNPWQAASALRTTGPLEALGSFPLCLIVLWAVALGSIVYGVYCLVRAKDARR